MVDVYLVSGFLGSGKTTFLKDFIKQLKTEGKQPAVFMNELGELPIDSTTLKKQDQIPLKELLNSCICCSGAEMTEAQIQNLLFEYPTIDVLIIETTGAAHPIEALDAVFSPLFASKLIFKGIITIVDSQRWLHRNQLPPRLLSLFLEQIRHAHCLLVNKTDLLTEKELMHVTNELSHLQSHAALIQTVQGQVPVAFIEQSLHGKKTIEKEGKLSIKGHGLETRLFEFVTPIDRLAFEKWVQSLPDSIYRIKGYVQLNDTSYPALFQFAYGLIHWMPEYIKMKPQIVMIGEALDQIEFPF